MRSQLIFCSNCGSQVPEVLASCQYCGTPVPGVTNTASKPGSNAYAPKPPELPAWLETLRSSERPPTPASKESSYSLADSIDENALPSWMRSDKVDNSAKMPAIRPASQPAPNTEGNTVNAIGMSASSLIDEHSLPAWMQESQALSQAGQQGIPAASLVQSDALPHWMKNVPPQVAQTPPLQSATPSISGQASVYTPPEVPQQRLSGRDLIDQQALPSWMAAQTPGVVTQGNGPGNVAGGSLIDPNALPAWLRGGVAQEQRGANMPPSGVSGVPAMPGPQPAQPMQPMQLSGMNNNNGVSPLIDMDALPSWLRSAEEQHGQSNGNNGNIGDQNRPGVGSPARVENMRVPSRPRAEMPSLEESAVAANVFASMLGVASANVPGQMQNGPLAPANRPNNGNGGTSGPGNSNWSGFPEGMASAQMPPQASPPGYGMPMSPGMGNSQNGQGSSMSGMPQQSAIGNFQSNQAYQTNQRNQGMPQQQAGNNYQGEQSTEGQQKQNGKKRGFLETILNWFPFSR